MDGGREEEGGRPCEEAELDGEEDEADQHQGVDYDVPLDRGRAQRLPHIGRKQRLACHGIREGCHEMVTKCRASARGRSRNGREMSGNREAVVTKWSRNGRK